MSHQPQIQTRGAQHYAAIPMAVTMDTISGAVDEAFPALFGWLAGDGIAPSGPPFIRYLVIDMASELEIELGVPVGAPVTGSGRVQPGTLPEGRYAVLRHTGPYDGLIASNAALQQWRANTGSIPIPGTPPRPSPVPPGRALSHRPVQGAPTLPSAKSTWHT